MIPTLIVPTLIHYDLLQNMLDSIDEKIDHIIIIDNGGKLEQATCDMAGRVSIINLPANIGVAASWNLGIKLTPFSKWWVIANDDILWNRNGLSLLKSAISEKTIVADWSDKYSVFCAFALDEQTVDIVGLFDEYYYPGVGEEVNYLNRAHMNNIDAIQVNGLFSTQGSSGRTRAYLEGLHPIMQSIWIDNVVEGMSQPVMRGWSLEKRREYPF